MKHPALGERWDGGEEQGRELIKDDTKVEVMKPPALGDGGGKEGIEMVEDKKSMEVTKLPALGERWDG